MPSDPSHPFLSGSNSLVVSPKAYNGKCLNDGRAGMDPNPEGAIYWFDRSSGAPFCHPHGQYQLGVAFYTGEGVMEDEVEAVRLFELAARRHHAGACYMLGDCLLDGMGVEMDRANAMEWLVRAAQIGHRGARSRVMSVLEKREGVGHGNFTDASRETLVSATLPSSLMGRVGRWHTRDCDYGSNRDGEDEDHRCQ